MYVPPTWPQYLDYRATYAKETRKCRRKGPTVDRFTLLQLHDSFIRGERDRTVEQHEISIDT